MERDAVPLDVPTEGEKTIMVVGHNDCGKTCLIASFVNESPVDSAKALPKGFCKRRIIDFGREWVKVVLKEGDNKFSYMRTMDYVGVSAVLVCFSFNDVESMKSVPQWINEARSHGRSADLTVVGCKVDMKHKTSISPMEWTRIEKVIAPYKYLECSARTGEGVSHLVRVVGNALLNQTQSENGADHSVVQL